MLDALFGTREQKFWKWFMNQSERLFNFESRQQETFDQLTKELKKVHPDLTFEFGPKKEGKREFVISAEGIKKAFPSVIKLVETAPKMDNWKVIAFRQKKDMKNIEFEGLELTDRDMRIIYSKNGEHTDLKIYVKNYNEKDRRYINLVFLWLDALLGEYAVATKIGAIEIVRLGTEKGLVPFKEIQNII